MEPQTVDLRTCPGGFVELRRMTYGELMTSQDLAYQIQMKASEVDPDAPEMGLNITRMAIIEYQLKTCVMNHNLEDEAGRHLDFRQSRDCHLLDANIGQEINDAIEKMHNWNRQFPNSEKSSLNGSSEEGKPAGMAAGKNASLPGPSVKPTDSSA
jgi:hypothetical protein